MTPEEAEERSASAGEYVHGAASADARAPVEREMQRDPAMLAEVYF